MPVLNDAFYEDLNRHRLQGQLGGGTGSHRREPILESQIAEMQIAVITGSTVQDLLVMGSAVGLIVDDIAKNAGVVIDAEWAKVKNGE